MFKNKFWMKIAKPVNNCLIDLNYFFFLLYTFLLLIWLNVLRENKILIIFITDVYFKKTIKLYQNMNEINRISTKNKEKIQVRISRVHPRCTVWVQLFVYQCFFISVSWMNPTKREKNAISPDSNLLCNKVRFFCSWGQKR